MKKYFFSLFVLFLSACTLVTKPESFTLISTKTIEPSKSPKSWEVLSPTPISIEKCAQLAWIFQVSGEQLDRTSLVNSALAMVPEANALSDVAIEQDTFSVLFLYNKPCKRLRGTPIRISNKS